MREFITTSIGCEGVFESFNLIGQSWGGILGMQFASHRPKGLEALVVADSPASMKLGVSEANKLRAELPIEVEETLKRHEGMEATEDPEYLAAVDVFYSRHLCRIPIPTCVSDSFAQMNTDPTMYHTMNGPSEFPVTGSLKDWDNHDDLHKINVPTLLISGAYDEATPAIVSQIHTRIPGSVWELFPESSHLPHIEEPARFKRIVNAFLDEKTK